MKQTRMEIVSNREIPIVLIYDVEGIKDPITDEVIGGEENEKSTTGVVTEISSQGTIDRFLTNGILVEKGDIWFSVVIEELVDIYETITGAIYDGKHYEIQSKDKKGIGERNRAEFVGRLIS
ncbi:hypothetical protein J1P26_20140 [Neobacillus sp. MM2021_6]|nr:hypothetical protein [Neobacillus sp. MM2021_6]MBO0962019.1 hypothetical protein [Neobacillus sp. MM2021_6]NHC20286.1 hypothetical protein [Bacillus sp. MM2020_4]